MGVIAQTILTCPNNMSLYGNWSTQKNQFNIVIIMIIIIFVYINKNIEIYLKITSMHHVILNVI
jgi:hypothetical protein